ncbi:MAG: Puromycin resistance protein pur8 [Frondihabitans sp.]|nr:Puromycin resistance protein pur8 [Frondihabitans sp.]
MRPPASPVTGDLDPVAAGIGALGPAEARQHRLRWVVLAMLALAQLTIVLDSTVVNIALPSAQAALHFTDNNRQWIITAYSLSFGSLLLLGGRLADLVGRKTMLIIGLAGFASASAVGGAATSFGMLVAARAVQGGFAAMLAPALLALLTTTFSNGNERARAFGIFGAIAGGGSAVGLLLGGVLTEYASWLWTMYVNILTVVPALAGAIFLLARNRSEHRPRIDIPGTITVTAGLFALVYGLSNAETDGWGSGTTVGYLIAAGVLLVAFVVIQTRSKHPLLPLRIVLDRVRGGGFLAMLVSGSAMFAVFLFMTYFLQQNLRYTPVQTGLAFLPLTAALVLVAAVAGPPLTRRVSPKVIIPLGALLGALSMFLFTNVQLDSTYAANVLPGLLVMGAGLGLIFSSAQNISTLGIRPDDAGVASATVNTVQQVGGSIGTALLNTIASSAATAFLVGKVASQQNAALAAVHSYSVAFWWATGIFLLGAVASAIVLPRGVPQGLSDDDSEGAPAIMH